MASTSLLLTVCGLLLSALTSSEGASSIVSNSAPRVDAATGEILDIHDGVTLRINDTFYWYGAGYGGCTEMSSGCASVKVGACGFNLNHTVNLATSTDLVNWNFVGSVLPEANRPVGIMFSPWVAISKTTGLYVLWFNMLPTPGGQGDFDAAYYVVATSATPEGPFVVSNPNVTGVGYTALPDAPSIFVDDDGQGYIAFTHEDSHINNVQLLTPDLLGPAKGGGISPQIGGPNNEGILMFKRNGLYYVMFGQCCCFCSAGSNVEVHVATSPLGPYNLTGTLTTSAAWGAQTGAVWFTGQDYVLYGDRWQSASDHIKSHDFSYMTPIVFTEDGGVEEITAFQDNVTINY